VIISRTPLRISFVGGGSDLAAYYRHAPGAVVSTAIDKYIYITVNRKFDSRIRASYSVTEIVDNVDEVRHELIREALKLVGVDGGIEITSISDIPSEGTGLGSSSTYTVGLLTALYGYIGRHVGAERLAREACEIEIKRCGRPIGKQDQYMAAYGGLQYMQFNPDESVFVDPIICPPALRQTLRSHLMLMFMGTTRASSAILTEQRSNTEHDSGRISMRLAASCTTAGWPRSSWRPGSAMGASMSGTTARARPAPSAARCLARAAAASCCCTRTRRATSPSSARFPNCAASNLPLSRKAPK